MLSSSKLCFIWITWCSKTLYEFLKFGFFLRNKKMKLVCCYFKVLSCPFQRTHIPLGDLRAEFKQWGWVGQMRLAPANGLICRLRLSMYWHSYNYCLLSPPMPIILIFRNGYCFIGYTELHWSHSRKFPKHTKKEKHSRNPHPKLLGEAQLGILSFV